MNEERPAGRAWVYSGAETVPVPAPCTWIGPPRPAPLADAAATLRAALDEPVGSPPLRALAAGAHSAAIAIPDLSRDCPNELILPALFDELNAGGVPDERIVVLIGCGLHRTTSEDEKRQLAGEHAYRRVRVADAQGIDSPLVDLGITSGGCPALLHRDIADAGLVITVGVLEPHLYAGYSGGVKGVAIGCAGEATIAWTHRPAFISAGGVELCRLDGNPFQQTLREVAARSRLSFGVLAVVDGDGRLVDLAAGDPAQAQELLAGRCGPAWLCEVSHPFDVVIAGIKAPKHENLYQASRAATYIGLAARPALVDGGLLLLCADLPKRAGDGPGELNFARLLSEADANSIVCRGLEGPLGPGGQRAFVVARVLRRFRLGVCGGGDAGLLRSLGVAAYPTLAAGLADAAGPGGRAAHVLAVADALTSVVRAAG